MKWQEFTKLTVNGKINVLYQYGTFIVGIRYYKYKINLYEIDNRLVEVFFNHKLDVIEKIEAMDRNTKRLKFYSDQIKIKTY